jgi:hypothetical protein
LIPLFDPADIIVLGKTSKDIRANDLGSFNINAKLKRFFKDPRGFRSIQAQCDALICNDFARRFFTGAQWPLLSTYVFKSFDILKDYLEAEGYKVLQNHNNPPMNNNAYTRVVQYQKVTTQGSTTLIFVHSAPTLPAIYSLLIKAMTTSNLAFITWNKAYSLASLTTLVKKEAYLLGEVSEAISPGLMVHEKEGI